MNDQKQDTQNAPEEPKTPPSEASQGEAQKKDIPKIVPVMHILVNLEDNSVGVVMGEHFKTLLDDPVQVYGYLKAAEKQIDWFYSQKTTFRDNFLRGVSIAKNKERFRNFIGKHRKKR